MSSKDAHTADDRSDGQSVLAQLSSEMVRLYKEQFGRGPTRVRSEWAGDDAILRTLEDTMTPAERNLVRMGQHQRLRDTRMFFQYASEQEFRETAERVTGRTVRAFVSGIDAEQDISTELFYLTPSGA